MSFPPFNGVFNSVYSSSVKMLKSAYAYLDVIYLVADINVRRTDR